MISRAAPRRAVRLPIEPCDPMSADLRRNTSIPASITSIGKTNTALCLDANANPTARPVIVSRLIEGAFEISSTENCLQSVMTILQFWHIQPQAKQGSRGNELDQWRVLGIQPEVALPRHVSRIYVI